MNHIADKVTCFNQEIGYLKHQKYIEDYKTLIRLLPDYFFEVPASSTGKYHPKYTLGEGGLLRHTKAAVRIAYELLNNPLIGEKYTEEEKDLIYIALTVHDGLKSGLEKSKYTKAEHPRLIVEYIHQNKDQLHFTETELILISKMILSHMGPWNTDYFTKEEILPVPKDKYERFVHMCDYLASRKCLLLDFDEQNNIIID